MYKFGQYSSSLDNNQSSFLGLNGSVLLQKNGPSVLPAIEGHRPWTTHELTLALMLQECGPGNIHVDCGQICLNTK